MYQNATNYLESDGNLPIENPRDKISEFLFMSYVTRKLRVLHETDPRTCVCLHLISAQTGGHLVMSHCVMPANLM